jgi:hypothetical protein
VGITGSIISAGVGVVVVAGALGSGCEVVVEGLVVGLFVNSSARCSSCVNDTSAAGDGRRISEAGRLISFNSLVSEVSTSFSAGELSVWVGCKILVDPAVVIPLKSSL